MRLSALFLAALLAPGLVAAQEEIDQSELQELLRIKMRTVQHMALNPALIQAVRRQNAEHLDMNTIKQRDDEWKATKKLTPLKRSLQENSAGQMLKRYVIRNPSLNEAFLTDNQGANVAAYPATSDYWQGDEEKWTASFNEGAGKLFLGPVERDESTNTLAVQVSAPLFHQGETIGVLVVGVTFDYLNTKRGGN
jgi:Double sensory domain of two-component sensor kinase